MASWVRSVGEEGEEAGSEGEEGESGEEESEEGESEEEAEEVDGMEMEEEEGDEGVDDREDATGDEGSDDGERAIAAKREQYGPNTLSIATPKFVDLLSLGDEELEALGDDAEAPRPLAFAQVRVVPRGARPHARPRPRARAALLRPARVGDAGQDKIRCDTIR